MKPKAAFILLIAMPMLDFSVAEEPAAGVRESVTVVGSPPLFGRIDGVDFEYRRVARVTWDEAVYICHRQQGEKNNQGKVIDRIIWESPADGDKRTYYEIPSELYRDLEYPHVGSSSEVQTLCSLARNGPMLTIFVSGSDGAYSYVANWIIDLDKAKVRRIIANGECDDGLSTPWIDLKKIGKPNIESEPAKNNKKP